MVEVGGGTGALHDLGAGGEDGAGSSGGEERGGGAEALGAEGGAEERHVVCGLCGEV